MPSPRTQTNERTIGLSVPTRDPKTKTQQLRREVGTDNCRTQKFKRCVRISNPIPPDLYISSDASKAGWGACCQDLTANGRWPPLEAAQHINVLELKAAFLPMKAFSKDRSHIPVCIRMDNTTAVAQVKNRGGTRSPQLVNLTLELWLWCRPRAILISAQQLPRKLNAVADRESREFYDANERQIDSQVILPFIRRCNVDLFASRLTALLPTYASWKPDPGATYTDENDPGLVSPKRVRLSPIQPTCSSAEEGFSGQSRPGPSRSSLAGTALVASSSEPSSQGSFYDPKLKHLLRDPASPL